MDANGESKAKRLRHIFNTQPNYIVGKLLAALLELESTLEENSYQQIDDATRQRVRAVADRLRQGTHIEDAAALTQTRTIRTLKYLRRNNTSSSAPVKIKTSTSPAATASASSTPLAPPTQTSTSRSPVSSPASTTPPRLYPSRLRQRQPKRNRLGRRISPHRLRGPPRLRPHQPAA